MVLGSETTITRCATVIVMGILLFIRSLITFQTLLEEIVPKVMDHKNAKVREGMLLCISETLQKYVVSYSCLFHNSPLI